LGSRSVDYLKVGGGVGALVAAAQALEMLAGNARTINPWSGTALVVVWVVFGAAVGAGSGWLGGTAARRWRHPSDAALFLSALVTGHLFLPLGFGPALAVFFGVNRRLRRWLFPRISRLDGAAAVGLTAATAWGLLKLLGPLPPDVADAELSRGTPLPGSVPVTISVHSTPDFPAVPAVHVPLKPLAAEDHGRRAALWSGRVPSRTRSGNAIPRHLPGAGGLSWIPARPGVIALTGLLPVAAPEEPPFETVGSLPAIVAAAGIPVLRSEPSGDDPLLFLRILDGDRAPSLEWVEEARRQGAWIDVTLGPERDREVALSGLGISLQPSEGDLTLMDVTPTVLHLLGLAIPRGCDGRVLVEHLDSNGPGRREPRYRDLGAPGAFPGVPD
jgi:hypothetical protein